MKNTNKKVKESIKSMAVFSIILLIFIPMLTVVSIVVTPKIMEYFEIKEKKAVLEIFDISIPPQANIEDIRQIFEKSIVIEEKWKKRVFEYYNDKNLQGYAFVETRIGYGFNKSAPISILVGFEPDLVTLKKIIPLDYGETPGLGGRISEKWFQNQFKGKKLRPQIKWTSNPEKTKNNPHEFAAITGATTTTKGIAKFLNDMMKDLWKIIDGEKIL